MSALSPCKHTSRKWGHFPRGTYCRTAARFIPICSLKGLRPMGLVELGLPKTCDRPCSSLYCPVWPGVPGYCLESCSSLLLLLTPWWSDTVCLFSVSWEPLCICLRLIFKVTVAACVFVRLNCPLIAVAVCAWGLFCFLSYNLFLPCFGT